MEEEETRNTIIDMVNQIDRLDVLEYLKVFISLKLEECADE